METYKKVLIKVAVLIVTHAAIGGGLYILGTKTCKPDGTTTITPGKPSPHTVINKPTDKNSICGKEITVTPTLESEKKLKLVMKDNCKTTTAYYDLNYTCPIKRHEIGFGPSALFVYDNTVSKFTVLFGGKLEYTHFWGNLGLGGVIGGYSGLGKSAYAGSIDLMIKVRF
jgi:hypothetical protein